MKIYLKIILLTQLIIYSDVNIAQTISTFAGCTLTSGCSGSGDGGPATAANIGGPTGGNFDRFGNYYYAGRFDNVVRKVSNTGIISTIAGWGTGGDGGPATAASLNGPTDVAADTSGNLYIAELQANRIRRVDAITGIISTIAGNGTAGFSGDGLPATASILNNPAFIFIDKLDNIYFSDFNNQRIRKINYSGIISTIAGNGNYGFSSDGGPADTTMLHNPFGVTVDSAGNLYIADNSNNRVRKVDAISGIITTVVGNGVAGYNGEGLDATSAQVIPVDLKFDALGNLYIADDGNERVRGVNTSGIVTTIAGTGIPGFSGDGGLATNAQINSPEGIAVDACNNVYIADLENQRVRKVTFNPTCSIDSLDSNASLNVNNINININTTINIYPNPTTNELTISANTQIKEITISNMMGQTVASPRPSPRGEGVTTLRVDISGLPEGVYMVAVIDEEGNKVVRKIIKE